MENKIKCITYGEVDNPSTCEVGKFGVTEIRYHVLNYGDHGIGEFHVFKGEILHAKIMHRSICETFYFDGDNNEKTQ